MGALFALVVTSTGYAIATRTPEDFLLFGGVLSALYLAFLTKLVFDTASPSGRPLPRSSFRHFCRLMAIAASLAVLTYGVGVGVKDLYRWTYTAEYALFIMVAAMLCGSILFEFRKSLRLLYGFTEVLVGLVVAATRQTQDTSLTELGPFLAFLTAGVYLVVRGLDNIHHALKSDPPDPLVRLIRAKLTPSQVAIPPLPRRAKKKGERTATRDTMRQRRTARPRQ